MSDRQITIAIDAMGGEGSPFKTLKGAEIFSKTHPEVHIKLFGNQRILLEVLNKYKISLNKFDR